MTHRALILLALLIGARTIAPRALAAQTFAPDDHWYNNPLGFDPVELHARNGFLIPALAVGICLLLTDRDSVYTGTRSHHAENGLSFGYKYPYATLYQQNFGVQFQLRKWMSVGVDMGVYVPRDRFNNTFGIAVRPFARFFGVNQPGWRLFFEAGGGLVWFADEFPKPTDRDARRGTQLNGTTRYGIGGEINLGPNVALLLGARHIHVSNGNTSGADRNPSHDSNGFLLGASYAPGR